MEMFFLKLCQCYSNLILAFEITLTSYIYLNKDSCIGYVDAVDNATES